MTHRAHSTLITVDVEVFNAIRGLRVNTSETLGEALRRFLRLDDRDRRLMLRINDNIKCLRTLETQLRTQRRRGIRAAQKRKHS